MATQQCPECKRGVYQLFKKAGRVACAYCFGNLWAINEEKKQAKGKERRDETTK